MIESYCICDIGTMAEVLIVMSGAKDTVVLQLVTGGCMQEDTATY